MTRISFKMFIGLLLSGCTVNNIHFDSLGAERVTTIRETTVVIDKERKHAASAPAVIPTPVVTGNIHIRPECGPYIPLPMPEPVKIDLTKLQAAASSQEINAIVLQNVKDLRQQMQSYAVQQQKHYAEYVHRCVVR